MRARRTRPVDVNAVPLLDGVRGALAAGYVTGGATRNADWVSPEVDWNDTGDEWRALLSDPQTSGGLLVALAPERVAAYRERVPAAVEVS